MPRCGKEKTDGTIQGRYEWSLVSAREPGGRVAALSREGIEAPGDSLEGDRWSGPRARSESDESRVGAVVLLGEEVGSGEPAVLGGTSRFRGGDDESPSVG